MEDFPAGSVGFVYLMKHVPTGRKYIGRKLSTKAKTRQKNNKKIRSRVESDWRDYWSSSPEITQMIEADGTDDFTREILMFAFNKSQLMYLEERFLYTVGAMESVDWINSNIRAKVFKRNVLNKIDTAELSALLASV